MAIVAALAGMIAFGTSTPPQPLASISDPFRSVDFRDLPAVQTLATRKGSPIAYRTYAAAAPQQAERVVIAIHGSAGTSTSLHPLAKALRDAGITTYVPDIRGHGGSGRRGDIDYVAQLDDDLADLTTAVREKHPQARLVLLGFSSGGGFALRSAAGPLGAQFERTVLLSPMLGINAPTARKAGSENTWVKAYIPRIVGLMLLNRIGIHAFDGLPVLAFAIRPEQADILTGFYSFRLVQAFGTNDYAADLKRAPSSLAVVVGAKDELFVADAYAPTVRAVRTDAPVTIVPELHHIEITTDPRALPAILAAVRPHG
ncbi:MAG: alpha/beta fold hydrolase [Variibacter sp.]|nr:alpha/beta fold hydrolase [Variibacter sp.]